MMRRMGRKQQIRLFGQSAETAAAGVRPGCRKTRFRPVLSKQNKNVMTGSFNQSIILFIIKQKIP